MAVRSGKTKLCLHECTASQEPTFLREKLDKKYSNRGFQTVSFHSTEYYFKRSVHNSQKKKALLVNYKDELTDAV